MNVLVQRDLKELEDMRRKADTLNAQDLVEYVKKWGDCTKKTRVSCTEQAKASISTSYFLKNINVGRNLDLFVAQYKSDCEHYISMLTEDN